MSESKNILKENKQVPVEPLGTDESAKKRIRAVVETEKQTSESVADEEAETKGDKHAKEEAAKGGAIKGFGGLLKSGWIASNIPFFLFLTFLAVLYIANGHYGDKTIRKINKVSKDLKELQYEYKTLKADVMFRSKESELVKAVAPLGLKTLEEPPVRIKMK